MDRINRIDRINKIGPTTSRSISILLSI